MKAKGLCLMAAAACACGALVGCSDDGGKTQKVFHVYMPDGAPAIALSELMHEGYYATDFTVVSASTISARVSSGDADLAIMPINAAAALYNGGKKITMLSVQTHGNLYFVGEKAEGVTLGDLVGKKVGVIGRGQVPDLTLRMLLDESGIKYEEAESAAADKVSITYGADGPSLLPLLKQGKIDYAFLAEPAATNAVKSLSTESKQLAIVMDAQRLWADTIGGEYPQACLVAKSDVVSSNPEYVKWFLRALQSSDGWAAENPDKAVKAVADNMEKGVASTLPASLASDVIARCNIKTAYAWDAKADCAAYFSRLTAMKTELGTAVLSKVPDDGFYLSAWN
ncbi:MAG: ABC transporter substrate-binding protein [Clostridiales bacterium]|nr:ABC transporter substrate-binding protein [Clostridiales bacterium]